MVLKLGDSYEFDILRVLISFNLFGLLRGLVAQIYYKRTTYLCSAPKQFSDTSMINRAYDCEIPH